MHIQGILDMQIVQHNKIIIQNSKKPLSLPKEAIMINQGGCDGRLMIKKNYYDTYGQFLLY